MQKRREIRETEMFKLCIILFLQGCGGETSVCDLPSSGGKKVFAYIFCFHKCFTFAHCVLLIMLHKFLAAHFESNVKTIYKKQCENYAGGKRFSSMWPPMLLHQL